MRITSKGQVTIPIEIRNKLGFLPDTSVIFVVTGNSVMLQKDLTAPTRGEKLIGQLSGRGSLNMSTDEIMNLTRC